MSRLRTSPNAATAALPHDMRGRAADDEYRLACKRKLPHRMIDLFRNLCRPRALVDARQLVEHEPEFPVIGFQRLDRPRPGKYHERCVGSVRPALGNEKRQLRAERFDVERIEK